MIHDKSEIHHSVDCPPGLTVWAFATVCANVKFGKDCVVGSCAYVGRDCVLGDNVRIQHGAFIPNHTKIGSNVFIGPNVTLTDDRFPVAGNKDYLAEPPRIEDGVSIGAGAVILPGLKLGKCCLIGAGAIVTKDVEAYAVVIGNPGTPTRTLDEPLRLVT